MILEKQEIEEMLVYSTKVVHRKGWIGFLFSMIVILLIALIGAFDENAGIVAFAFFCIPTFLFLALISERLHELIEIGKTDLRLKFYLKKVR